MSEVQRRADEIDRRMHELLDKVMAEALMRIADGKDATRHIQIWEDMNLSLFKLDSCLVWRER